MSVPRVDDTEMAAVSRAIERNQLTYDPRASEEVMTRHSTSSDHTITSLLFVGMTTMLVATRAGAERPNKQSLVGETFDQWERAARGGERRQRSGRFGAARLGFRLSSGSCLVAVAHGARPLSHILDIRTLEILRL